MTRKRPHIVEFEREPETPPSAPAPGPLAPEDIARIERFLHKLRDARYFGKVTLSFQNGRVTDIRTEQVMKLDEL